MLAAFLGGLALGSGLSGWWASDRQRAVAGFALAQVATAVLAAGAYSGLCALDLGETGLAANALLAVLVILPSALCIGATFPLAVRICARAAPEAGPATARIYTWNTGGGITGSVLAGFYFLPALGFAGSLHLAVGGQPGPGAGRPGADCASVWPPECHLWLCWHRLAGSLPTSPTDALTG